MPFCFGNEGIMVSFLNKLAYLRREIILFLAYGMDFLFSREFSNSGTPVKIRPVVFKYELIIYDTIVFICWLCNFL